MSSGFGLSLPRDCAAMLGSLDPLKGFELVVRRTVVLLSTSNPF